MGYTTDFEGAFDLDKPLTPAQKEYLIAFSETRRMKRNAKVEAFPDSRRIAVGLPVGKDGEYYVGGIEDGNMGQNEDASTVNHNGPPANQPGLWCQWIPNEEGTAIVWDCGEKFYNYIEWITYLRDHFLKPWGYVLNGEMEWVGEETDDRGKIIIKDNVIKVYTMQPTWGEADEIE